MQKLVLLEDILVEYKIIPKGAAVYLVEQPVKTQPKPQVEPKIKPGKEKPEKEDPFRPPRPVVEPKPKAFKKKSLKEGYEDEVEPSIAAFWKDIRNKGHQHAFGKHPVLAIHGDELSRQGYEHHEDIDFDPNEMMQLMMQVQQVEAPHKKELEHLAKQIAMEIWGVPEEMLKADLTRNTDVAAEREGEKEVEEEDQEIPPELLGQINKRITLNTFTQGAAVHQMMTMHHLIDKKLSEINPNLVKMYSKLSKLMHKAYWYIDFSMLDNLANTAAGSEKVEWDEGGNPTVVAKAWIFPILAQELSKGIMELLTMHGYSNLDAETQGALQKHADKLKHEPYLIMIGPTLWRKFLKVVPKDIKLADLIAAFSKLEPEEVHEIVDDVLDNPGQAEERLGRLVPTEPKMEKY